MASTSKLNRSSRRNKSLLLLKPSIFQSFLLAILFWLLLLIFLALRSGHFLLTSPPSSYCDVFDGSWVADRFSHPLYNASDCPFVEKGFNCAANGRRDGDYQSWKWKPRQCDLPRFDPREALHTLSGKRVVFVGDSMSRTQWESLVCMLRAGVEEKKSVYEVKGNRISKQIRHLAVRFGSYDLSVEFYRSVFLVQHGRAPKNAPKRVRSTLKLDALDEISRRWVDSDVLIFNSGHWWNSGKLFDSGSYFQVNGTVKLGISIMSAFRSALSTWALWAESTLNTSRTQVFFRTFEASHWSNGTTHKCTVSKFPLKEPGENNRSVISDIITHVIGQTKIQATILHVTSMGAYRRDAHVGHWGDIASPDCSHWCLPGVPDAWNEVMFSYILSKNAT